MEAEKDERRVALIKEEVLESIAKYEKWAKSGIKTGFPGIPHVALHELLGEDVKDLYAVRFVCSGDSSLDMCTVKASDDIEALHDARVWLARCASIPLKKLGPIALDLRHAPKLEAEADKRVMMRAKG